jgi:nitroreductase
VVIWEINTSKNYEKIVKDFIENWYILEEKAWDLKNTLTKNRKVEKLREMCIRNCSLASMNLIFSFENFGISTCPMMWFNQEKMAEFLKLWKTEIPILLISLWFAEKKVLKKQIERKSFEELFKFL